MGPRELVILLLGLALVAVVLRGLHVAMTARRGQIKLAIDKNIPKDIDLESLEMSEFPNGGARVVARSLQQVNQQNRVANTQPFAAPATASDPLRNSSSIPVLMDNVELSQSDLQTTEFDDSLIDDLYDNDADFIVADEEDKEVNPVDTLKKVTTKGVDDIAGKKGTESEAIVAQQNLSETTELDKADSSDNIAAEFEDLDVIEDDWLFDNEIDSDLPEQTPVAKNINDVEADIVENTTVAMQKEEQADLEELQKLEELKELKELKKQEVHKPEVKRTIQGTAAESKAELSAAEVDKELKTAEIGDTGDTGDTREAYNSVETDNVDALEAEQEPQHPDVYRYNDPRQDNGERREPALTFDEELMDEFSNFSMTAGERIGAAKPLADQGELFDNDHGNEASASASSRKKKSFFANLAKKVIPEKDFEEHGSSGEYEVFPEEVYEQGELVDPILDEELQNDMEEVATNAGIYSEYSDQLEDFDVDEEDRLDQTMEMLEETLSGLEHKGAIDFGLNIELADAEDLKTHTTVEDEKVTAMAPRPEPKPEPAPVIDGPSEVVVLNVMSREGREFHGNDLLQVLITSGLKFGEMNIFHKRLENSNHGPVLFSVANIINPGIFDLNSMEEFRTRGVTLFLTLPSAINNLEALELMLETAQQIRGALDGELRDDSRNVMTAQTIEHYRQRVRDFELSLLKIASRH